MNASYISNENRKVVKTAIESYRINSFKSNSEQKKTFQPIIFILYLSDFSIEFIPFEHELNLSVFSIDT